MTNRNTRMTHCSLMLALVVSLASVSGCIADGKSRVPEQRVTYVPKEQNEPIYHLRPPPAVSVTGNDFDTLWSQIYRVTRDAGFYPDVEDYRRGVMTTRPLVGSQFFEPWRGDTVTLHDRVAVSLATIRRTVRWDVKRGDDGTYTAEPRVLVERWTLLEHRVTTGAQYAEIFQLTREEAKNSLLRATDPASFVDAPAPTAYWYPTGRDPALEKFLAERVQGRL